MRYEVIPPTISTCSLKIINAIEKTDRTYFSDWHIHREYEMILLLCGNKFFYINDEEIKLCAGDIIFIDSNIPHKTYTPIGSCSFMLQFNISSAKNSFDEPNIDGILLKNKSAYTILKSDSTINPQLAECISKIRSEYLTQNDYYEYFIKSYLYELTALLYRNKILADYNEILEKIPHFLPLLKYIDEHYKEQISLSEISDIMNFHKSYFCKKFKDTLGISFVEYLNLVRLDKAKNLMNTTTKNISEIAFEVGFSSVSYFIKTFKKHNYCSPNKFKALLSTDKKTTVF